MFVALLTVAINVSAPEPVWMVAVDGDTLTETGCVARIVTVAAADFVGSSTDTAVTVTVACAGSVVGAVYTPATEIVPTVALPPAAPLTFQLTDVSAAFATVARKLCVPPT